MNLLNLDRKEANSRMAAKDYIDAREAEIAQFSQSRSNVAELQRHLSDVLEGDAFRGSPRSGRFLKYIVEESLAGHFDSLKERVIGIELFGRSASYDTGEDAIVRVTASDVRKRLLQHYGRYGAPIAKFRISLPLGSYLPEFTRIDEEAPDPATSVPEHEAPSDAMETPAAAVHLQEPTATANESLTQKRIPSFWIWSAAIASVGALGLLAFVFAHPTPSNPLRTNAAAYPWPELASAATRTELITSDPNIAEIQGFTGGQLTISDYANHRYFVGPKALSPEQDRFCRIILRGDKAASFDTAIASDIAALAAINGEPVVVRAARDIQFSDLKTDDNFVMLGSPRSNPWFSLFNDQLDFRFIFDPQMQSEAIQNFHPRAGEQTAFIPTAKGWATGQSYAIVALVQNPDQKGHVLLLAGATAEGTAAAGKVVTDGSRLMPMLKRCGVDASGPVQHFELLLRLNTIAGSANEIDYAACHLLPALNKPAKP